MDKIYLNTIIVTREIEECEITLEKLTRSRVKSSVLR